MRCIALFLGFLVTTAAALGATRAPDGPTHAPRWYKGNTHTHSLWSDGDDFPEMICDWYRQRGYHFLGLSDHNILSEGEKWWDVDGIVRRAGTDAVITKYRQRFDENWIESRTHEEQEQIRLKTLAEFRPLFEKEGEFLLIQAEEITDSFARLPVHINAINLTELIPPQGGDSIRDVMRNNFRAAQAQEDATGQPMIVHLNHPNFGWGITAEDLAHVIEDRFFEVFNGHPGVRHLGDETHPSVERLWDIANTIRLNELNAPPLLGVATDDSHNYHNAGPTLSTSGRGWIMVRAMELSASALIEAMKAGDFYASSGVTLRDVIFDADAGTLTVQVEPDPGASYEILFIGTLDDADMTAEDVFDVSGRPLTRRYTDDIGRVLQTTKGARATYTLTGNELYVRAVVRSSLPHVNPVWEGQVREAWTQPVGWSHRLDHE